MSDFIRVFQILQIVPPQEEMKKEFNDVNYWKSSLPDISVELKLLEEEKDVMECEENFNCYQYWKIPHPEFDPEFFKSKK